MTTNKDKIRASAQKFLQKGQVDKAIKEFQRLVEEDPKDVRTLLKIGDLETRTGDHAAATKTYGQVAQFYADQGFFLKAVAVYKQILKIDPTLVDINIKLAELYHQLGLLSDASNQYRQISGIYEKLGKIDESIQVLRKMVELDPENVASRIKLAEMLAKQNMVDEARNEFRSAATFLKAHHRVDDYVKVAERIVHFDPGDLDTTRELANIYIQKKDARRALAKLQVCFKANPKDAETLALLANAFRDLGQIPKTLSVYKELARIHQDAGNTEAYQSVMRKVLDLAPDDPDARAALGQGRPAPAKPAPPPQSEPMRTPGTAAPEADVDLEDVDLDSAEVEVEADEAVAIVEAEPIPTPATGGDAVLRILTEVDVYIKYGLKPKALEHIQKVFEIDPSHREARIKYKELLIEAQDTRGAVRELWLMASAAHRANRLDQARDDLEELLGMEPRHSQARELLRTIAPGATPLKPASGAATETPPTQLAYEPSPVAAEIDLDEDTEPRRPVAPTPMSEVTTAAEEVAAFLDEPLDVEPPPEPSTVIKGESKLPTVKQRPSEVMGARTQSRVNTTSASESGSTTLTLDAAPEAVAAPVVAPVVAPVAAPIVAPVAAPTPTPPKPAPQKPTAKETATAKGAQLDDELEALLASAVPKKRPTGPVAAVPPPKPTPFTTTTPVAAPKPTPLPTAPVAAPTAVVHEPVAEPGSDLDFGDEAIEPTLDSHVAATPAAEPEPAAEADLSEEIEEVTFFQQQGLEDEARDALAALLKKYPAHSGVLALKTQVEAALAPPAPAAAPEPAVPAAKAPSVETEPEPEPDLEPEPETVQMDTVDLASELAKDLNEAAADDDFQVSFRDVFDEFKKGVAEQVEASDFDTHYNLGIAYKEMGLLPDAVREFEATVKAAGRHIGAITMIGLCHLELGNTDQALEAFLRGINDEKVTPEEAMALRFEVGAAYEGMGRFREACKFYEKVAAMDPKFRDVDTRLQEAKRQSADQAGEAGDELDALLEDSPPAKPRDSKADKISYL